MIIIVKVLIEYNMLIFEVFSFKECHADLKIENPKYKLSKFADTIIMLYAIEEI